MLKVSAFIANEKLRNGAIAKFSAMTLAQLTAERQSIENCGKGLKKRFDNPKPRENVTALVRELQIHRRRYAEIVTAIKFR